MEKLTRFFYEKTSGKKIAVTAVLAAAAVISNFALYFSKFLRTTGGTAYMELNFGYMPDDLFEFAELYGTAGRRMYIAMSATLDMLTPFFTAMLLIWIAMSLAKRANSAKYCRPAVTVSLIACLSDWAENLCMITILASYPSRIMLAAVLARICTSLKYAMMIAVIVLLLLIIRNRPQNIKR